MTKRTRRKDRPTLIVAADVRELERVFGFGNRTMTMSGQLTVMTKQLGIWEYSPITHACCKTFKSKRCAKDLTDKLLSNGIRFEIGKC